MIKHLPLASHFQLAHGQSLGWHTNPFTPCSWLPCQTQLSPAFPQDFPIWAQWDFSCCVHPLCASALGRHWAHPFPLQWLSWSHSVPSLQGQMSIIMSVKRLGFFQDPPFLRVLLQLVKYTADKVQMLTTFHLGGVSSPVCHPSVYWFCGDRSHVSYLLS